MRPLSLLVIGAFASLGSIASPSMAEAPGAQGSPPPAANPPAAGAPASAQGGASQAPGAAAPPAPNAGAQSIPSPPSAPAPTPPVATPGVQPSGPPPAQPPVYGPLPYGQPAPYYSGYPTPYAATAPPAAPLDARSHSGFFLRMAVGGGYLANSSTLSGATYRGSVDSLGGAVGLDVAVGGALSPGIILAGSYAFLTVSNAQLKNDTRSIQVPHDPSLTMLGGMLDVYPNAKGGFHLGSTLGLATLLIREEGTARASGGPQNGFGFAPHVGYEWWVGNYWGLGVLGKFLLAYTEGSYGGSGQKDTVTGVSILFSATYN